MSERRVCGLMGARQVNTGSVGPGGLFNFFNDRWIATAQAARIFFSCTLCVAFATPVFLGLDLARAYSRLGLFKDIAGGVAAAGTLFIWFGMWRYWARVDSHSKWLKRLSFFVLLIGFWWGSCLYFFCGYLPEVLRRTRAEA
jgi:hypothetical protein